MTEAVQLRGNDERHFHGEEGTDEVEKARERDRGLSAKAFVAMDVAIALAVSWNSLVKSKARATTTTSTRFTVAGRLAGRLGRRQRWDGQGDRSGGWAPDILPLLTDDDPLGVDDFATHVLPLSEAPAAYDMFQKKADGAVKVVFQP